MYQPEVVYCRLLHYVALRHIIVFLCFFITCNSYIIRDLIPETIDVWAKMIQVQPQAMSADCNSTSEFFEVQRIYLPKNRITSISSTDWIMFQNVYYVGTLFTLPTSGYITDKRGGRKTLLIYGICATLHTILTPMIIQISVGNTIVLLTWRAIAGLLGGLLYTGTIGVVAHWTPIHRRSTVIGVLNCTYGVGSVMSRIIGKLTVKASGYWQTPFYIWAAIAACSTALWYWIGYSSPRTHPFIPRREKRYLHKNLGRSTLPFERKKIPCTKIFTSIPFWASCMNHLGRGWLFFSMLSYGRKFFHRVLRIDFAKNVYLGYLLPFSMIGMSTVFSGIFCDFLVNSQLMDITTTRKIFSNFGASGGAIYLMTISLSGCNQLLAYCIYIVTVTLYGVYDIGVSVSDIDLSPNYAATLKGITQSLRHIVTIIVPIVMAKITEDQTIVAYRNMFLVIVAVVLVTNVIFTIFGRATEQPWNRSQLKKQRQQD